MVVTGGNTLLPGFVERLSADTVNYLNSQQPNLGSKLGFLAPRTSAERLFAAWIGGKHGQSLQQKIVWLCSDSTWSKNARGSPLLLLHRLNRLDAGDFQYILGHSVGV